MITSAAAAAGTGNTRRGNRPKDRGVGQFDEPSPHLSNSLFHLRAMNQLSFTSLDRSPRVDNNFLSNAESVVPATFDPCLWPWSWPLIRTSWSFGLSWDLSFLCHPWRVHTFFFCLTFIIVCTQLILTPKKAKDPWMAAAHLKFSCCVMRPPTVGP